MIIGLFPNAEKKESFNLAKEINKFLSKKNITVVAEDDKAEIINAKPLSSVNFNDIKFLFPMFFG